MIDEIDRQILGYLQDNARTSNAESARRIGMAPSAILERIRRLEERGLIRGYTVRLDSVALEQGLLAFILVRTDERVWQTNTGTALAKIPEVQEVHHIAGEDCFLVKVRARDTDALGRILRERFGAIRTIRSTRTTIVLNTVKDSSDLLVGSSKEETVHA